MKSLKTIFSKANQYFFNHKLLSSLILCVVFFLIYFTISGFSILSRNDDYVIFKLIYFGDIGIPCISYFYAAFCSWIQQFCGDLNSYMIGQEIICFLALLAINFVFLSKLKSKTGLFLTLIFDTIFFSFLLQEILFSFTSTVGCSAGFLLIIYGSLYEQRKKYKILQPILGVLLVILGVQLRFEPILPVICVVFVFVICALIVDYIKLKKFNTVKNSLFGVCKRITKTGIILILTVVLLFAINSASTALKNNDDGYKELNGYNTYSSKVIDYKIALFNANKEFYSKLDINNAVDLDILTDWFIDDDFFTVEKLKAISDYSRETVDDGIADKGVFSYIMTPVIKAFSNMANSSMIIVYVLLMIVFVFAIILMILLRLKYRGVIIRVLIFSLLWAFLLFVSSGFNENNLLFLPLLFITFFISIKYNGYQAITSFALFLTMTALYFYLMTLRLFFHTSLAVIFPVFIMMIFALDKSNSVFTEKTKRITRIPLIIVSALLIVSTIFTSISVYKQRVYAPNKERNDIIWEYIDNHPDNVYVINQAGLLKGYYNPLLVPKEYSNVVNYGLWVKKSSYIQTAYKNNSIKHLFKDIIDSNKYIVLYEEELDSGIVLVTPILEEYYNEHYTKKGEEISFVKTDSIAGYSIYKVVSKKADK